MNEAHDVNALKPSVLRAFFRILLLVLFFVAIMESVERIRIGRWHYQDDPWRLLAAMLTLSTFACFAFVPRRIGWSAAEFYIQFWIGSQKRYRWNELEAYGGGRGVFTLKFLRRTRTYQIFPGAFGSMEWNMFKTFLNSSFPDKRAIIWLGTKPILRNRKAQP